MNESYILTTAALLAPVPLQHLESGSSVCDSEGKVAFGSRAFETFHKLDALRGGLPVNVYIYPSHTEDDRPPMASWLGRYIGWVESLAGAHPQGMQYRPPTTAAYPSDNKGHWAIFWELDQLHELPKGAWVKTHEIIGLDRKTPYQKGFIPEGPLLIEHP
jgi:hypothetical protein